MAEVVVAGADLILYSRVETQLAPLGHHVRRSRDVARAGSADVALCDAEPVDPDEAVELLRPARAPGLRLARVSPKRSYAPASAGFDRVVARSAIAERLPALVDDLLGRRLVYDARP